MISYPNLHILHDSKKPLSKEGNYWINIEQFLSKKIVSNFSNKKWVFLNINWTRKIIEYKNIENINCDILIETIKNKIYISWNHFII